MSSLPGGASGLGAHETEVGAGGVDGDQERGREDARHAECAAAECLCVSVLCVHISRGVNR